MERKLRGLAKKFPDEIRGALFVKAEDIMRVSKRDFVPVAPDGGALRSSGHVRPPMRGRGRMVQVELVYGGTSAPYATAIHEHPSAASPPSWKNKPKLDFHLGGDRTGYLIKPMNAAVPTLARDLAKLLNVDRMAS